MEKENVRDSFTPEEWSEIAYLNKYDRRVMGTLLYSLAVTTKASDWTLITSMDKLRERCGIKMQTLYQSCNKLEQLGFFEWIRGKKRVAGERSIGARFIFNPDLIYNPPTEMPSGKELLMKKFNLGRVKVNTSLNINSSSSLNINSSSSLKENSSSSLNINSSSSLKENSSSSLKENSINKLNNNDITGNNNIENNDITGNK